MRHYAAIVEEKSVLRRLIRTAGDISQLSYEGKEDVNAIMDTAEKSIFDIMQKAPFRDSSIISEISRSARLKKSRISTVPKGKLTGVPNGLSGF